MSIEYKEIKNIKMPESIPMSTQEIADMFDVEKYIERMKKRYNYTDKEIEEMRKIIKNER